MAFNLQATPTTSKRLDLLKRIDDAASQYGNSSDPQNQSASIFKRKNQQAKNVAQFLLSERKRQTSFNQKDLDTINSQRFDHKKTLPEYSQQQKNQDYEEEDYRSLRSEYDYGSKKKFVDILGNFKKVGLSSQMFNKNQEVDKQSIKSKIDSIQSLSNSKRFEDRKQDTLQLLEKAKNTETISPIKEEQDEDGVIFEQNQEEPQQTNLSNEDLAVLEEVVKHNDVKTLNEEQQQILKKINFNKLMDYNNLSNVLNNLGISYNKKMYNFGNKSYLQSSQQMQQKQLQKILNSPTDAHQHRRNQSNQTSINKQMNKEMYDFMAADYDYNSGGLSFSHRKPDNLIGLKLREMKTNADALNRQMSKERTDLETSFKSYSVRSNSQFPLTTNQDFHGIEVFKNSLDFNKGIDKLNFKRKDPLTAYVDAMFNTGVFVNPVLDQV